MTIEGFRGKSGESKKTNVEYIQRIRGAMGTYQTLGWGARSNPFNEGWFGVHYNTYKATHIDMFSFPINVMRRWFCLRKKKTRWHTLIGKAKLIDLILDTKNCFSPNCRGWTLTIVLRDDWTSSTCSMSYALSAILSQHAREAVPHRDDEALGLKHHKHNAH